MSSIQKMKMKRRLIEMHQFKSHKKISQILLFFLFFNLFNPQDDGGKENLCHKFTKGKHFSDFFFEIAN
jgi:hypothetical protein